LVYILTNLPNLLIIFPNFLHNALDMILITTSFNCRPSSMCVHTSHWPYGYPPFTLCPWQWTHRDLCYHCMKCWFSCGMRTTTCASLNHSQFLLSTNQHFVHQSWNLHLSWRCHSWPIIYIDLIPRSYTT